MASSKLVTSLSARLAKKENLERLHKFYKAEIRDAMKAENDADVRSLGRTLDLIEEAMKDGE